MCELILPSVHSSFFKVAQCTMVWFYELHYRKTKFAAICRAVYTNELYAGLLYSGHLLSGTCWQKLTVEWHWLKFLWSQIFLHFGQFNFFSSPACDKRLVNWTATTDYIKHRMDLQGTQSMGLTLGNAQIWLGTTPVVLKFILAFFHCVVCSCLFAISIRSHSDIGRMTERFWQ